MVEQIVHLRHAKDLMDRAYDEPLDVPALARAAHMSPAHFSRRFRSVFGETPHGYLCTRRIERAKALLRGTELSVTEICFAVGFQSLGSFSSRFSDIVGVGPSEYRASTERAWPVPGCYAMAMTRSSRNGEATGALAR